jgi:hypothetical protein
MRHAGTQYEEDEHQRYYRRDETCDGQNRQVRVVAYRASSAIGTCTSEAVIGGKVGNDRWGRPKENVQLAVISLDTTAYDQKGGNMKRAIIAVVLLSLAFAAPILAAEGGTPPSAPGKTFEQRQADMLKFADERIATLQEGKNCVKAAKNDDDLTACKEKFMAEMKKKRDEMKQKRGMMGGPQGEMGGSQGK